MRAWTSNIAVGCTSTPQRSFKNAAAFTLAWSLTSAHFFWNALSSAALASPLSCGKSLHTCA